MSDKVYEIITERVLKLLDEGTVPWRQPWNVSPGGRPQFPVSIGGYPFRGINVFLLGCSPYSSPVWMSWNQAKKHGGRVRDGEEKNYTIVIFWKIMKVEDKDAAARGERATKTIPLLRYFRVYNLEQTEGVKVPPKVSKMIGEHDDMVAAATAPNPIAEAEKIVAAYTEHGAPPVRQGSNEAWYDRGEDRIQVPSIGQYDRAEEYYSTLFHEFGHSTGAEHRLNRWRDGGRYKFDKHTYGCEELVAEMTAAMLCGVAGITVTHENSAAYLRHWMNVIKADVRAVVLAAAAAQKAADHIRGVKQADREDSAADGTESAEGAASPTHSLAA